MRRRPVIAIDGPSGAGKSTVARGLARALDFSYLDTGALYRTVAWLADRHGTSWDDGPALAALARSRRFEFDETGALRVDGEAVGDSIRTPEMSRGASIVAQHPEVRRELLGIQRRLGRDGGVVLEGRDIGTVVFPDAEVKFYLTASVRERAKRRHQELKGRGQEVPLEQVEAEQVERDRADREREVSPLRRAENADEIDCENLSAEEVVALMKSRVTARFPLTWDTKDNK